MPPKPQPAPRRFEDAREMLVDALAERYSCDASSAIPAQWQRFVPHLGTLPGQVGKVAYGVCYNSDDAGDFDYLSRTGVGGIVICIPIES